MTHAFVMLCVATLPVGAIRGQTPPGWESLGRAQALLAEEFTAITSVRELADGRVLISDPRERRIVSADLRTGTVQQIGRTGRGPGEYPNAMPLVRLARDTSLMADTFGRRWLLFHGDAIVGTLPPDAHEMRLYSFYGADTLGRVLSTEESRTPFDSIAVVLVDRPTGRRELVTTLRPADVVRPGERRPLFERYEAARLASDGWIAVLRTEPYRVDWRSPAGQWVRGAPIALPGTRLTDEGKRLLLRHYAPGRPPRDPDTISGWPETVPAIRNATEQRLTLDGHLLVERVPTVAAPGRRYDVVDRTGRVVRRIALPSSQRIVGFGKQAVFVVSTDGDGIETLSKHPW